MMNYYTYTHTYTPMHIHTHTYTHTYTHKHNDGDKESSINTTFNIINIHYKVYCYSSSCEQVLW